MRPLQLIRHFSRRIDPSVEYNFIPAKPEHFEPIRDLCNEFIKVEPHSKALNLKPAEGEHLFHWIVAKSLMYPYSYLITEKSSSKPVGFRTMSIGNRDSALDKEAFPLDLEKLSENVLVLGGILEESKDNFWKVAPKNVNKVLRREVTFVLPEHQRKGIAKYLLHLGLDFQQLKSEGVGGIVSEASSIANQTLLSSEGYKCVYEPKYDLKMHDGTTNIKVFFKDFATI